MTENTVGTRGRLVQETIRECIKTVQCPIWYDLSIPIVLFWLYLVYVYLFHIIGSDAVWIHCQFRSDE